MIGYSIVADAYRHIDGNALCDWSKRTFFRTKSTKNAQEKCIRFDFHVNGAQINFYAFQNEYRMKGTCASRERVELIFHITLFTGRPVCIVQWTWWTMLVSIYQALGLSIEQIDMSRHFTDWVVLRVGIWFYSIIRVNPHPLTISNSHSRNCREDQFVLLLNSQFWWYGGVFSLLGTFGVISSIH